MVYPLFLFGGIEFAIIGFAIILLFFGPKKIPKLARSVGQATQEWKRGRNKSREELENEIDTANDTPSTESATTDTETAVESTDATTD